MDGRAALKRKLLVDSSVATLKINPFIFTLYFAALAASGGWAVFRQREITRKKVVMFALGGETVQAVFSVIIGAVAGNGVLVVSSTVPAVFFAGAAVLWQRKRQ